MQEAQPVQFEVEGSIAVSGLLLFPNNPRACYVLAHGAGAGMRHSSLEATAAGLHHRGIATLRYQFPFMEAGSRRPDPPKVAHAAVRVAVAEAGRLMPSLPLFAGGRSFGGRMTSQAQALGPLPGIRGLIFLAFPLHPAGRPSIDRAAHLHDIHIPMLFVQGTRDALAEEVLIRSVTADLGARATLKMLNGADHSFAVLTRSGRTSAEVGREALDAMATWMDGHGVS